MIGAPRRYDGPLGKSDRAFAFGLLAVLHRHRHRAGAVEHALSRGAACSCRRSPCSTARAASLPKPKGAEHEPHPRAPGQRRLFHRRHLCAADRSPRSWSRCMRWRNPGERYAELVARTDSWWWMIGAFTLAILLNQTVAIVFLALHRLSRAEGISLARADQAHRPRGAAVRLSRHSHPVLLGGDRLVQHVHRLHPRVDVPVLPGADGAARARRKASCARSARCPGD